MFDPTAEPTAIVKGLRIFEHWLVEPGRALLSGWGTDVYVNKFNQYGERAGVETYRTTPLWTRHMLGTIEAARDRRRRMK